MRRKVLIFTMNLLWVVFDRVNSQADQTGIPSADGLLCISECTTCPVICSPPPSPVTKKQPLPPPAPPVPSALPPVHHYPPPQFYYFSSPPPIGSRSSPPPSPTPPAHTSGGKIMPPPPPPPTHNNGENIPSVQAPPGINVVPRNYTYPYYYFYTSEASVLQGVSLFKPLLVFSALSLYLSI